MAHRAGFVNIIGNPNVGKSTLMNILVQEKLSIITPKAQTTRHRIMGIVNTEDVQLVYSDTPGILEPAYRMQEGMMNFVMSALEDADVILFLTEPHEKKIKNEAIFERIKRSGTPVILVINKIDLCQPDELEACVGLWEKRLPDSIILPISALKRINIEQVEKHLMALLPESPPYFPKDELSDKPMRFFISEIIREKIFTHYKKEVPYSCEVEVEEYKDTEKLVSIRAVIHVARDSQKGIIIGHRGAGLKRVGSEARRDMESFINKKVYLELFVKVSKDWRNKDRSLRKFGYLN